VPAFHDFDNVKVPLALCLSSYDNFEDSTTLISTSDGRHIIHFDPNFEGFWDEAEGYGFGDVRVIGNDALSALVTS
jgi:hypothetical protein